MQISNATLIDRPRARPEAPGVVISWRGVCLALRTRQHARICKRYHGRRIKRSLLNSSPIEGQTVNFLPGDRSDWYHHTNRSTLFAHLYTMHDLELVADDNVRLMCAGVFV